MTEEETLDHLAGSWKIFQLKRGHRFSADDVLTAWEACNTCPHASSILDLGCGIGSVGLLCLFRLSLSAQLMGVEAQPISLALARRTVELNGLSDRVRLIEGDLRDPKSMERVGLFPLITGSPPYFPVNKATSSPYSQRAAARMELRGDIHDYCLCAARHLSPEGRFVFVHAAADPRPELAIEQAGLKMLSRRQVYFRRRLQPTIALYGCGWNGEVESPETFTIRDREGAWTQQYVDMRAEMGTRVVNGAYLKGAVS